MAHQLRAQSIVGFAPLVTELGGDARQLLRNAGLDPAELEQPDIYILHRAFIQLLEDAADGLRCPDFGLRLLDRQDLSVLGPIALAAQHAADLREAIDCLARYIHVQGSAWRLYLLPQADPGQVMIAVDLRLRRPIARRQQMELAVGLAHKAIELLTGGRCMPLTTCLPHSRIAPLRSYRERLRGKLLFEQPGAGIRISREDLGLPVNDGHAELADAALSYLQSQYGRGEERLAVRVRALIRPLLAAGRCGVEHIAASLAMHPRTLHRRLTREGARFEEIKDDVRREMAQSLIAQAGLSMTQIASALGYAEQSALSRSCVRWFGHSPRCLRQSTGAGQHSRPRFAVDRNRRMER
ncbi:MAG: AraC family transcriptional regulator [Dechloromonas sp.]|jgi:AraC-like DNA-binding protein|nr:AraC family transcriptional regulator [Dechloromonas sp.]